jgi:hypothetical protein
MASEAVQFLADALGADVEDILDVAEAADAVYSNLPGSIHITGTGADGEPFDYVEHDPRLPVGTLRGLVMSGCKITVEMPIGITATYEKE